MNPSYVVFWCSLCLYYYVFFFKQKTAYEMRISDWSSDVCSSDLSIQDVPISVSAFSAKSLDEQKIEGGSELVRAVPNVSFSKTNFASYNFSIRGIGTKALSVTSDPAVAISFNNTPLIRNRLFEQEYFDVEIGRAHV